MKTIATYIVEKLKINKDTKIEYHLPVKGDKICFLTMKQPGNWRREGCPLEIMVHNPMTVEEIDTKNKKITYYTSDHRKISNSFTMVNKYGFMEDDSNSYDRDVILNKEETISLLKELYKSTKRITLDFFTNKYFENIEGLDFKYWNNEIRFITTISSCAVDLNRKIITSLIEQYEKD